LAAFFVYLFRREWIFMERMFILLVLYVDHQEQAVIFHDYLRILASEGGSDLYLSTGAPPSAKFQGKLRPLADTPLKADETKEIAYGLMDAQQRAEFEREFEMNLAVSIPGIGRFRINIFIQRNQVSIVARNIVTQIPNYQDLLLPEILTDVIMTKRGLVLFVGATGSGKSTSLAALIDHRNTHSAGHIITIEDPVEFLHQHKKSVINQREVGVDTRSFHAALKNTLRQAPDVILIGEIRDRETMEHALAFAETGHLAISTLHANNANQALDRIINFFPEERRPQLLMDLSSNLRAIVSQRLIPTTDQKRAAAVEILLGTYTISELILRGDFSSIKEIMEKSENLGMQTFDHAVVKLYLEGRITEDDAIRNADSANNVRLKIKMANNILPTGDLGLSIEPTEEDGFPGMPKFRL
jgi:twitching motility protein PilU